MVQTSDQVQFQDKANFIWQVADDILFGPFMHNEFRDVVLPFVVLRRLDCSYTNDIRQKVRSDYQQFKNTLPDQMFYNTGINTYIWLVTNQKPPTGKARCS